MRNTNYADHLHRRDDLLKCFTRIFCEESDHSKADQKLVREISNEFPQYFKQSIYTYFFRGYQFKSSHKDGSSFLSPSLNLSNCSSPINEGVSLTFVFIFIPIQLRHHYQGFEGLRKRIFNETRKKQVMVWRSPPKFCLRVFM